LRREKDNIRLMITGFASLTTAKFAFLISGYAIYFSLPRFLNSPADFGDYGVVIGFFNIINMILVISATQSASKFISADPCNERSIRVAFYKIQFWLAFPLFVIIFLGASAVARFFNDPSLALGFRLGSFIPLSYAFYAVNIGSMNGQKKFQLQALMDICFSILKCSFVIGAAALGFGVSGSVGGFAAASMITVVISMLIILKIQKTKSPMQIIANKMFGFELNVIILTFFQNLLIQSDLFWIKHLAVDQYSSDLAGIYASVQACSRFSFSLVAAIGLLIFPVISELSSIKELGQLRKHIQITLHVTLILVIPAALLFILFPSELLGFVYPPEYRAGEEALRVLGFGSLCLAILSVVITVITSIGQPIISSLILWVALMIQSFLCFWLIPRYSIIGAACASTIGWTSGVILCLLWLFIKFKATLRLNMIGVGAFTY
jgi:O-antigen/teichoic acid export membrane protein